MLAWLAIFATPLLIAPRERRRTTAIATLLGAAVFFLARNAASATPDTLAAALACIGFARIATRQRIDAPSAALVVLAPFFKPSCIGVSLGVAIAFTFDKSSRREKVVTVATALGVAAAAMAFSTLVSDGAWLVHIVRSTHQPLDVARFVREMGSRVVLLGVPHAVIATQAIRRRAPLVVSVPLATSIAWSTFAMAKHGSGTQYWLEPTAAALVAFATLPSPFGKRWAPAGFAFAFVIALTSLPAMHAEVSSWHAYRAALAEVDRHCARDPGDAIVSTDVTLELALDGRLFVPSWQSSFLVRSGTFPIDAWRSDLRDPHVRWLVLGFDPDEPNLHPTADERVEVSAFRDLLRPVIDETFVHDGRIGPWHVFRRRDDVALRR
jgi:hypothetical protein